MRLLLMHGDHAGQITGAHSMAELLAAELRSREEDVMLATGEETWGLLARQSHPPDVVHAFDLAHCDFATLGRELAEHCGAAFALTPASAPLVWDDPAGGAELCRAADVVFALTRAEADRLSYAGVDPRRIACVGQGAHLEGDPDAATFVDHHRLRPPIVLFLGRKTRSKRYRALLEAMPTVWRRHPETSFVFAGPRVDPDCSRVFAAHLDPRLTELDTLDEPEKHSALVACDVVCLPSDVEVFPLVLAEAWHCGKPVVCGHFEGAGEVVREGVDGVLAGAEPAALASALLRLLDDETTRHTMGQNGRSRARREMTWEAVAERVLDGYRRAGAGVRAGT